MYNVICISWCDTNVNWLQKIFNFRQLGNKTKILLEMNSHDAILLYLSCGEVEMVGNNVVIQCLQDKTTPINMQN
jgi:hypothetical protein